MTAAAWVAAWFATLMFGGAFWLGHIAATDPRSNGGDGFCAFMLGAGGFALAWCAVRMAAGAP